MLVAGDFCSIIAGLLTDTEVKVIKHRLVEGMAKPTLVALFNTMYHIAHPMHPSLFIDQRTARVTLQSLTGAPVQHHLTRLFPLPAI